MPRAGPLRYWSLTLIGFGLALGAVAAFLAIIPVALRGGRGRLWTATFGRREKRLADRIARGEAPMPTIAPPPASKPVPSLTPLNRTWPPATWEPADALPAQSRESPVEELNRLAELKDRGAITVAEFEAHKKRILGGI